MKVQFVFMKKMALRKKENLKQLKEEKCMNIDLI